MSTIVIECKKRDTKVKSKELLSKFRLPAVMYGSKTKSTALEMDYQDFRKAIKSAGQGQIIKLNIDGNDFNVLIKSYDLDLVKHTFTHVDFYVVDMDKKVHAKIPIELYGTSEAVKLGGILSQKLDTIEVNCKPADLPLSYKADIGILVESTSHVTVADLEGIDNAEIFIGLDSIVAGIIIPRTVVEETTEEEGADIEGETETGEGEQEGEEDKKGDDEGSKQ